MQAYHMDTGGSDFFQCAMEFKASGQDGHPMANREIQEFMIDQDQGEEEWQIIVQNPDSGQIRLFIMHPDTSEFLTHEDELRADSSESEMSRAVW